MNVKIYVEETFTTTVTREEIIINTDDYPELQGMTEDEISEYIDNNVWDMKPTNTELYSSLAEELNDQDTVHDSISGEDTTYYVDVETE
jgi:hypothetical protein